MKHLTRISHRFYTATTNMFMSIALHLNSLRIYPELRRNVLTNMLTSPVLRAPCIHEHLRGFVTKSCEKSGLTLFRLILQLTVLFYFMFAIYGIEAGDSGFTTTFKGKEYYWVFTMVKPVISEEKSFSDEHLDISFQIENSCIWMELGSKTGMSLDWSKTTYFSPDGEELRNQMTQFSVEYPDGVESKPMLETLSPGPVICTIGKDYKVLIGMFPYDQIQSGETIMSKGMEQNLFQDRKSPFLVATDPFLISEHGYDIVFRPRPEIFSDHGGTATHYLSSETIINQMVKDKQQLLETELFPGDPMNYSGKSFRINFVVEVDGDPREYEFGFSIKVLEEKTVSAVSRSSSAE